MTGCISNAAGFIVGDLTQSGLKVADDLGKLVVQVSSNDIAPQLTLQLTREFARNGLRPVVGLIMEAKV